MVQILLGLILFLIVIGAVVYSFEYFSNFFDELKAYANNTAGNDSTGSVFKAEVGERVCDLQFELHGEFDEWDFSPLRIRLGESTDQFGTTTTAHFPAVAQYYWKGCYEKEQSNFSPFSLIFYNKNNDISGQVPSLAFGTALGAGEKIAVQLKFTDSQGNSIDATKNAKLLKTVQLPSGIFQIPLVFEKTWIISDIKYQDYEVSIFAGREINDNGIGVPYVYNVLK